MPVVAKGWGRILPLGSKVLAAALRSASRALAAGRRTLGRIFPGEEDLARDLPLQRPSRSIRFLKRLGRLRRREGAIACDLGGLAKEIYRRRLRGPSR